MKKMLSGGTVLSKTDSVKYNKWKSALPKNLQYEGDYDLAGFWKANPNWSPSTPGAHMTDEYKLPNHPTFSNESKYFNESNKDKAGYWQDNTYIPFNPKIKDTVRELKDGGKVDSKQKPPIYVTDPHDPRLQAYQDSLKVAKKYNTEANSWSHTPLEIYKVGQTDFNKFKNTYTAESIDNLPPAKYSDPFTKGNVKNERELLEWERSHIYPEVKEDPLSFDAIGGDGLDYPRFKTPVQPYKVKRDQMQLAPISDLKQFPVDRQEPQPEQIDINSLNPNPEEWLSSQTTPFREAGFYKKNIIPGGEPIPTRDKKEFGGNMKATKKTPKKVLNKIIPIPAPRFGRKAANGEDIDLKDNTPNAWQGTGTGLDTRSAEAVPVPSGELVQQGIYQAQNQYAGSKPMQQPGNRPGSGPNLASDNDGDEPTQPEANDQPTQDDGSGTKKQLKVHGGGVNSISNPKFDTANMMLSGLQFAASALPNTPRKNNMEALQMGENRDPYGVRGSGAIFADGGEMQPNRIQQWNSSHPDQAITRPLADYQQEFTTTPFGRSKVDNYGSQAGTATGQPLTEMDKTNWNAFHGDEARNDPNYNTDALNHNGQGGQQTIGSSFKSYEYVHKNAAGQEIGHTAPSVTPMSQDQFSNWQDSNRTAMNKPISPESPTREAPMPIASPTPVAKPLGLQSNGFPTREEAVAKYKARGGAPLPSNYFTGGSKTSGDLRQMTADEDAEGKYGKRMKCDDGGDLEYEDYDQAVSGIRMLGEGSAQPMSTSPNPMIRFNGPSHAEGGIPLQYGEQGAEVQGGETGHIDPVDGSLHVDGAMKVPRVNGQSIPGLTGRSFQSLGNEIGKSEGKAAAIKDKAAAYATKIDPNSKYSGFAGGTVTAMLDGSAQKLNSIEQQKAAIGMIQKMMRDRSEDEGIDPKKAHTIFAKNGAVIKAEEGHKYDKHGARAYDEQVAKRLGYTGKANTKDYQDFLEKTYPDQVAQVLKEDGSPKAGWKDNMWGKRTDKITDRILATPRKKDDIQAVEPTGFERTLGEPPTPTPIDVPSFNRPTTKQQPKQETHKSLADSNNLGFADFLPAARYLLETPDSVPTGQINPQLLSPYQVSFQDRMNNNQSTFNSIQKQLGTTNPAALGSLAAQKYDADNSVAAEEFRTNQGIANGTANANIDIMNGAQRANVALNMEQLKNQSIAKSNTEAHKAQALAWISDSVAQNNYENMNIRVMEARHKYTVDENGNPIYNGGNASLNGSPGGYNPYQSDTTEERDADGNLIKTITKKRMASAAAKWGGLFKK